MRTGVDGGSPPDRVLIGGVGYRWFGDGSFALLTADALTELAWPEGVAVLDLGYGALHVAMDLGDVDPPYDRVVLLAVTERGREPARLYRFNVPPTVPDVQDVQERMYEAGAGVIDLDHLLSIGRHFGALPDDVVVIELEPHPGTTGDHLSAAAKALLPDAIEWAQREALAPARPNAGV